MPIDHKDYIFEKNMIIDEENNDCKEIYVFCEKIVHSHYRFHKIFYEGETIKKHQKIGKIVFEKYLLPNQDIKLIKKN